MTKKKAMARAAKQAAETQAAAVVWRRNLIPNSSCRSHMAYDYAVHPEGFTPRTPHCEAIATIGGQGGLGL